MIVFASKLIAIPRLWPRGLAARLTAPLGSSRHYYTLASGH